MVGLTSEVPLLFDVSRLVWRAWRGGLPTGIDRVCQAYAEHFQARSLAVVQRSGLHFVLTPAHSEELFKALLTDGGPRRSDLIKLLASALTASFGRKPRTGALYLNVGHTGLHEPSLPVWIARHRLRAVYLIHDLIPITHPQFCRSGEPEKHRRRMQNVLASAAGIIGNSRATLDDLEDFGRQTGKSVPPSTVALISGGNFSRKVRLQTPSRPYFVTVGTIEGRKNHQLLLDVWSGLASQFGRDAPELLIVGQRGWQADRVIKQLDDLGSLEGHVQEIRRSGDEELAQLIAGARALLMPSFAEGFGLPIIEALELGTPVIASDLPVYREIASDIPTYLDPSDREAWRGAIRSFASDSSDRTRQLVRIRDYKPPAWEEHFDEVDAWLAKL